MNKYTSCYLQIYLLHVRTKHDILHGTNVYMCYQKLSLKHWTVQTSHEIKST